MRGAWIFPALLVSLAVTVALEEGFCLLAGIRNRWDLALAALVNLLTNPAVVFLYCMNRLYGGLNPAAVTIVLELAAVAAEAVCYRAAAREIRHPWLFSAGANAFSCLLGAAVLSLF